MRISPLKEFFYYTRGERIGALVLIVICLLLFALPSFYHLIFPPDEDIDFSAFQNMLPPAKQAPEYGAEIPASRNAPVTREVSYFTFDPNLATKGEFVQLGLSPRMAQIILNYREKGGKFRKKEDLKKIYGLREEEYALLEPWIRIVGQPRPEWNLPKSTPNNSSQEPAKAAIFDKTGGNVYPAKGPLPQPEIDINSSTPEEWQLLRGIGPGFSKRITNFRDKLGGFYAIDQVAETFGLPDSTFQQIKPYLKLSPVFRKINVNTATLEELKMHPYLSNFQATVLFNYRKQHGNFESMENLKGIKAAFVESDWERLGHYFIFQ
ncbi:MAG: helix-hairpin-helix domain-containing protein [Saprospiraceae bacterium]|nr:MAG: helix-hairpin-helix domain-containing protein [Saprospiraceae bacterium]